MVVELDRGQVKAIGIHELLSANGGFGEGTGNPEQR